MAYLCNDQLEFIKQDAHVDSFSGVDPFLKDS
jgi:hypothetical protein